MRNLFSTDDNWLKLSLLIAVWIYLGEKLHGLTQMIKYYLER